MEEQLKVDDQLRAWAKGMYNMEAATELLLRGFGGRFTEPGWDWMHLDDDGRWWIDFQAIPEYIDGLSGGEQRFLNIVSSIGDGVPVVLGDVVPGLDRKLVSLVLAALAHAAGSHQHSDFSQNEDGTTSFKRLDSLYPWPEASTWT